MGVTPQIAQHLQRATKGGLGIDHRQGNRRAAACARTCRLCALSCFPRDLPVVFPKEVWHPPCWKPKWRCYETKDGCPARYLGADGPQDSRCPGTAARLWNRAAHWADQRRSAGGESRDSVSRAVEARARRCDRIRVGGLRK